MKKFTKMIALILSLTLLLCFPIGVSAAEAEDTGVDTAAKGSLTIYKVDLTNAEKDGAYSTIHLERLSQEERDWLDQMPTGASENNIYELKLLRIQQRHIMERIAEYESCDPETLFTASITDMRKPGKDKDGKQVDGAVQKMVMNNKDSAFVRVTQLREALNKVSGRIISLTTQIRQQEEFEKRYALELERLDIAKMRATGEVNVDPEGGTEDETVHD